MPSSFNCLFQVVAALWGLSATVSATKHDDVRTELLLWNATLLQQHQQRAACPEDYSPCTCDLTAYGLEVTCSDVSVQDIQDVFFRTQTFRLYLVMLSPSVPPSGSSVSLPADLLQDKRAENIFLICPPNNASPSIRVTIDPAAFEFTRFNTTAFGILNCDLAGQTDLQFLADFSVLNTLRFENTLNLGVIESLPSLPALTKLIISGCTGLETAAAFPDLTPARLQRLYLNGNGLSDETANGILVSVGSSSSASSLRELILANDRLTRIPRIASFSKLSVYDVSYNVVPFMSQLNLDFGGAVVTLVSLKSISLTAIEGGAFQGDFTYAQVNLENNNLREFRSDVFLSMLQQMATPPSGSGGEVLVTGNPIDCGCGLAWLIRDNQHLVPNVRNGVCGGFFRFEDLSSDSFTDCSS